jgi:hypothetical protein
MEVSNQRWLPLLGAHLPRTSRPELELTIMLRTLGEMGSSSISHRRNHSKDQGIILGLSFCPYLLTGLLHNHSGRKMRYQPDTQSNTHAGQESFYRMARLANLLAKQLDGEARTLAYRIKAEACSSLILEGAARVNGIWPSGIVALDLDGGPRIRLHIPRSHLSRRARRLIDHQAGGAPVVTRLSDQLGQLDLSSNNCPTKDSASGHSRVRVIPGRQATSNQ